MLVDDHLLFRQSLAAALHDDLHLHVVGATGDGQESLRLIERLQPNVAVLDIAMPGLGGLDLAPRIRSIAPDTKILILSMHEDTGYAHRAFKAGARGYALKSDSTDELRRAIMTVTRGVTYLSPGIATDFIDHLLAHPKTTPAHPPLLTPREQELCRLLAQGLTTEQLAAALKISPKTVRVHVANIMKKFSCRSRIELALQLRQMETP